MKYDREPAYGAGPGEQVHPILIEIGMDLRVYLRLDLRAFLRMHGIDPQSGEPSPEELQVFVIAGLKQFLRGQAYMVDADVTWIDEVGG